MVRKQAGADRDADPPKADWVDSGPSNADASRAASEITSESQTSKATLVSSKTPPNPLQTLTPQHKLNSAAKPESDEEEEDTLRLGLYLLLLVGSLVGMFWLWKHAYDITDAPYTQGRRLLAPDCAGLGFPGPHPVFDGPLWPARACLTDAKHPGSVFLWQPHASEDLLEVGCVHQDLSGSRATPTRDCRSRIAWELAEFRGQTIGPEFWDHTDVHRMHCVHVPGLAGTYRRQPRARPERQATAAASLVQDILFCAGYETPADDAFDGSGPDSPGSMWFRGLGWQEAICLTEGTQKALQKPSGRSPNPGGVGFDSEEIRRLINECGLKGAAAPSG